MTIGAVLLPSAAACGQDITSGLIGRWRLAETSGTSANDSSPSNNDGTYAGGVSLAASSTAPNGDVGPVFDGNNEVVIVSNESTYDLTGPFSVSAWFKVNVFEHPWQSIVTKGSTAWRIQRNANTNSIYFAVSGLSNFSVISPINVNDGQWHHVVGVYNGNTLKIYIDGAESASVNTNGTPSTNNYAVNIGHNAQETSRWWNGSILDVRVYNRALSAADVAFLYYADSLVAHWTLNESSGTTAADASGHGNAGTVTGTAAWTPAVIDNGFSLNGSTKIQTANLLGKPKNITVTAWANLATADSNGSEVISLGDHFRLRLDEGGATNVTFYDGSNWRTLGLTQTFAGSGWHHFAAILDDDNNLVKLYVDGVLAASAPTTASISYAGLGTNTVIGGHGNGGTSNDFFGIIDDVRVYNYVLSDAELAQVFGLIGRWKLSETTGPIAYDSSLADNDGTYYGGVTLNVGGPNPGDGDIAAYFDGNNDYVSISDEPYYDVTGRITVAAWIKVASFTKSWQAILTKGDSAWRLSRNGNSNSVHFACTGLSTNQVNGSVSVNDGGWHHVAGVYDGNSLDLYVDGELDATVASNGSIDTNNYNVEIARNGQASGRNFHGTIFDARVYNRALVPEEIADLYGSGPFAGVKLIKWVEVQ